MQGMPAKSSRRIGNSIKRTIVGGVDGTGQASIFRGNGLLRTLVVVRAREPTPEWLRAGRLAAAGTSRPGVALVIARIPMR